DIRRHRVTPREERPRGPLVPSLLHRAYRSKHNDIDTVAIRFPIGIGVMSRFTRTSDRKKPLTAASGKTSLISLRASLALDSSTTTMSPPRSPGFGAL